MADDRKCLEILKSLREKVNWMFEDERRQLLDQLYSLIKEWEGQLPDLGTIFRPEEIDYLVLQDVFNETPISGTPLVDFVIRTGYKDKRDKSLDKDGEPLLQRTTPVHRAARSCRMTIYDCMPKLFLIYVRLDVNYSDEHGYTHFHVACERGYLNVIEKFLELGQDPNCLVQKTGDSPLHLAANAHRAEVAELLLRKGGDPNLANAEGSTPLHIMCNHNCGSDELIKLLFNEDKHPNLDVNATDKVGDTPLLLASEYGYEEWIEPLLRNGADPNLANEKGLTPLHIICKSDQDNNLAKVFLNINKELNQPVQIDARDKLGRTPLQWAVANLKLHAVDVLLAHGADLSSFVFPTEDYFAATYTLECTLHVVVFLTMPIVDSLERKEYEMDQTAALTIMKTFARHGLIDEPMDIGKCLRSDEEFANSAKWQLVGPNRTLYDFLQLPPEEAEKFFTIKDYYEFTAKISYLCRSHRAYITHLCDIATRGFFRRWALKLFSEKTPWLSKRGSEQMIRQLKMKGLWELCMEAAGEDLEYLASLRTDNLKNNYNREIWALNSMNHIISKFAIQYENKYDKKFCMHDVEIEV